MTMPKMSMRADIYDEIELKDMLILIANTIVNQFNSEVKLFIFGTISAAFCEVFDGVIDQRGWFTPDKPALYDRYKNSKAKCIAASTKNGEIIMSIFLEESGVDYFSNLDEFCCCKE